MDGNLFVQFCRRYGKIRGMSANGNSGWNHPSANQPTVKKTKAPARWKGIAAGLAVTVSLVALCLWMFSGGDDAPKAKPDKGRGRIKEVTPASAPTVETNKVVEAKIEETDPAKRIVKVLSCETNAAFGRICERYVTADGKTHKLYRSSRPPIFKHGTDQLLAMALCHNENTRMPPMPLGGGNLDKQFRKSLEEPIEISPDDSPDIVARKQKVIEGRERVKELMDQGLTFNEIMAEHQKVFNENAEIRAKAARELQRIVDDGDTEGTHQYLLKVNIALQQMGIKELDEPKTTAERKAERAQRRAEREAARQENTNESK